MRSALVAVIVMLLGVVVLGTTWEGRPLDAVTWVDTISLARWGVFWGLLAVTASLASRWLGGLARSWLVVLPLLVWFLYELRGTLYPLAWFIYSVPTLAAWALGLSVGRFVWKLRGRGPRAGSRRLRAP